MLKPQADMTGIFCLMGKSKLHEIPHRDPVSGEELYISELACDGSGIVIRGKFAIPRYSRLEAEQARFLETFLRCRGMITSMEKELGISYPTVRARLDALLDALDLAPVKDDTPKKDKLAEKRRKILDQLESGEISPAEAKVKIRGGESQ